MAKKPTSSRLGRLARLGGLTSKVGSSYMAQQVTGLFQGEEARKQSRRKLHIKNAEMVAETMGSLKGAAMKLGQTVALMTESMDLPPEVAASLRTLNDKAEPVPAILVKKCIEKELERPVSELFSRFEDRPLGTASLGQAHAAWLEDGTPVVIKVLHPNIERSIDSDLAALRSMFVTGRVINRDKGEIEAIFEEMRERLHEEIDYYQEAANLEFFRSSLAHMDGLRIPGTYPALSTGRVLTMDRLAGMPLDEFLEGSTQAAQRRAADTLADSFHEMVYELNAIHADPHAGNYLFEQDGTVGLLDFGCVRRYDEHWIANYARAGLSAVAGEREQAMRHYMTLGCLLEEHRPEAADVLWEMVEIIVAPFRVDAYHAGSEDDRLQEQVNKIVPRILRYPEIRSPRELIYLNRALNGMYSMQRRLGARRDYGTLHHGYASRAVARAEGREP